MPQHGFCRAGERREAHGEVVWSWPPDAEAPPAVMMIRWSRGQESPVPGESTYKSSSHRAGRAGSSGWTCGDCRLHFFRRRATGISRCPAFPAPSTSTRAVSMIITRADSVARMQTPIQPSSPSRVSPSARPRTGSSGDPYAAAPRMTRDVSGILEARLRGHDAGECGCSFPIPACCLRFLIWPLLIRTMRRVRRPSPGGGGSSRVASATCGGVG